MKSFDIHNVGRTWDLELISVFNSKVMAILVSEKWRKSNARAHTRTWVWYSITFDTIQKTFQWYTTSINLILFGSFLRKLRQFQNRPIRIQHTRMHMLKWNFDYNPLLTSSRCTLNINFKWFQQETKTLWSIEELEL